MSDTTTAAHLHGWHKWLEVFDRQNDQHEKIVAALDGWFAKLGQNPPPAWEDKDTLNVLELAPGDGRLTVQMLKLLAKHTGKKINYFGIELGEASVAKANGALVALAAELPPGQLDGKVVQGDLFDGRPLQSKLSGGFTPDFTIMSHAMYFAPDKAKFLQEVAEVGHPNTVMMYAMNSRLSQEVPEDMGDLTRAFARVANRIHSIHPLSFDSSIHMPVDNPRQYLQRFREDASPEGLDQGGRDMYNLLSFLSQKSVKDMEAGNRERLLSEVEARLDKYGGNAIGLDNQVYFAFSAEADRSLRAAFSRAMVPQPGWQNAV